MMRLTRALGIALVAACALGLPRVASGQTPAKVHRIGVLLFSSPTVEPNVPPLKQALQALGYVEGRNVSFEYRFAEGKVERLPELAAELARLRPDVIVSLGGDVTPFARDATRDIPIVMVVSNDPVESGLVRSLARPGGNLTGLTLLLSELAGKRLEMLHEIAPRMARVAILWNPDHPDPDFKETGAAARKLGVQLQSVEVRRPTDFDAAFQAIAAQRAEALIVVSSRLMNLQRQKIVEFAAKNNLPLVTGWGPWGEVGALLVYGPNINEIVRRAGTYVDRVLRGARPADLPVEQPTRFELVVNLKTARLLGLSVPPSLRLRADRVIE